MQEIEGNDSATTIRLGHGPEHDHVVALKYGPDFLDEFTGLSRTNEHFDAVLVDATGSAFLFPAEVITRAISLAPNLLTVQGALMFIKADGILVVVRETLTGPMSVHVLNTTAQLYDLSPTLATHAQRLLGRDAHPIDQGSDISSQILMSSVPVLTLFGIKLKAGVESGVRRNAVLSSIDNYTPLTTIAHRLAESRSMSREELMEELKGLEQIRAIYPLFPKIPFLVHSFKNKIPFRLKDYLLASRLITQEQLDDMLFEQQNNRLDSSLRLGPLAVSKGYISARQLDLALQDEVFYGQSSDGKPAQRGARHTGEQAAVQSLVGHLGTTEPAILLQNLATGRETGVLSVEHRALQFRALYEKGRIVKAKLGKIKGNNAIIEFVSVWKEGIYAFIERQPPADLADASCDVTKPLDKLLLDSALAADNLQVTWRKLPKGPASPLERLEDRQGLLGSGQLTDPQEEDIIPAGELEIMKRLWSALQGLTPVTDTIASLGDVSTFEAARAIDRLLHYGLVKIPPMDLSLPLSKFQQIVEGVRERIGAERNQALLRLSLQDSQGYSAKARMFSIGALGEIGIDLAAARSAGISLSELLKAIEDWQIKYVERSKGEMDRNVLRDIVYRAHQSS